MNRSRRLTTITAPPSDQGQLALRRARPGDSRALERLAQLDSHPPLDGPVLVAEVAGELHAARSLGTGETIADPFQHTANLRPLLSARSAQISTRAKHRGRFAIRWRRLYARAEAR